jgi:hypothetical protein
MTEIVEGKQLDTSQMSWVCTLKTRFDTVSRDRKMLEPLLSFGEFAEAVRRVRTDP